MAPTGSEASHLRSAIKECGDLNQVSSNTEEENCADVFGKSTPVAHDKCKTDEAENILTNPELIKQVFVMEEFWIPLYNDSRSFLNYRIRS